MAPWRWYPLVVCPFDVLFAAPLMITSSSVLPRRLALQYLQRSRGPRLKRYYLVTRTQECTVLSSGEGATSIKSSARMSNFKAKDRWRPLARRQDNQEPPLTLSSKQRGIKAGSSGGKRKYDGSDEDGCRSYKRMHGPLRMNQIGSIEGVLQAASTECLPPSVMAAAWTQLSRLLRPQTLDRSHFDQMKALVNRTTCGLSEYRPVQLSQTAMALAKITKAIRNSGPCRVVYSSQEVFYDVLLAVADAAVPHLPRFDAQGYSNLAYALAIAGVTPKANGSFMFNHIAHAILALGDLKEFRPQGLSNLVWAYAKAGESHQRLFDLVAYEVIEHRQLCAFKAQDLSNLVWAYATAKIPDGRLFEKVADEVSQRSLETFEPQHCSNIVWACATANVSHPRLFGKVADEVTHRGLSSFNPQAVSNIVWAYATANVPHLRLFRKVADEVTRRDRASFGHQALSNIVWAFATAKAPSPLLFGRFTDAIIGLKQEFKPQQVANVLWAYAASGNVGSPLFAAMAPTAAALINRCSLQNLSNIAWAYAVADVEAPVLFNGRFVYVLLQKRDNFGVKELSQLHQWRLWMGENKPSTIGLPLELQRRCYRAFISGGTTGSALQNSVVSELRSIGLEPKEEHLAKRGFSLDALVEVNGKVIGVEVDGPWHFIGRKLTGKTLLKRRQIANVERMILVSVPYWDWERLGNDRRKRQGYLRSLLGM